MRPLLYSIVIAALVVCVLTIVRFDDEFLREWAVEVFGALLVFLAIYHVHPQRVRSSMLSTVFLVGLVTAGVSYVVRTDHVLSAVLVKISSGLVLFVVLEVVLRRVLRNAKERESALAAKVQGETETVHGAVTVTIPN